MKKIIAIIVLSLMLLHSASAQYQWQDPLNFNSFEVIDKYALIYNVGGVLLSNWLSEKKDYEGYWETTFYAEYHQEYDPHTSTTGVFMGKARLGRQFRKWVQVGGEAQFMKFKNAETSVVGVGGALYFNWYFIHRDKFRLYFDNGFGVIGTTRNFPSGGTSFNFTNFYGLSSSFKISSDAYMKIGVRNMHLSNAYLFGDDRNPAFDSVGFLVGFEFVM